MDKNPLSLKKRIPMTDILFTQDDDWFCRKCARLKDSAGAWKPAKADESELDVLPARTTSRISRGGSKSEVKVSI